MQGRNNRCLDNHVRDLAGRGLAYAVLILFGVAVVYPMLWLLATSLKTDEAVFFSPFSFPEWDNLQWLNYTRAWKSGRFGHYFGNSVFLTGAGVILVTLLSAMAAYAISRFRFKGSRLLFYIFLAGLMIPVQLAIVPLFFQLKSMDLLNTRSGLLGVYVAFGLPMGIFILTGFFRGLPGSLHESALIDGCSEWRAFWSIMFPLSRPGLFAVAIFTYLVIWNEFFMAFMFISGEGSGHLKTLPLGLASLTIVSQYKTDWGMAFAGLALMTLPTLVVYVLLQKQITRGLTMGALKG
jgi:N-acetylglucosamine transport system permease protein